MYKEIGDCDDIHLKMSLSQKGKKYLIPSLYTISGLPQHHTKRDGAYK